MAFVAEAPRFQNYKESRIGPGSYFHEQVQAKKIDSWTLLRHHQHPFGSHSEREANKSLPTNTGPPPRHVKESDSRPTEQMSKKGEKVSAAFATPHVARDSSRPIGEVQLLTPGPGAYQIPSFTEKLKNKVVTKIIRKQVNNVDSAVQFEEVGDWFKLKSASTDSLPIFKSQSGFTMKGSAAEERAKLITDHSSQEAAVHTVEINSALRHNHSKSSLRGSDIAQRSGDRSPSLNGKGVVSWKYENHSRERVECLIKQDATDPQLYEPKPYKPKYKDGPSASFRSDSKKFIPVIPWKKLSLKDKVKQLPGPGAYEAPGLSADITRRNRIHVNQKSALKWHLIPIRDNVELTEVSTFVPKLELPEGGKQIGGKGNRFEGFNYYAPKAIRRVRERLQQQEPPKLLLSNTSNQDQSSEVNITEEATKRSLDFHRVSKGLITKMTKPGQTVSQIPTPGPGTYDLARGFIKKPPGIYTSERTLSSSPESRQQLSYSQAVIADLVEASKLNQVQSRESLIKQRLDSLKSAEKISLSNLAERMSRARERREAPQVVLVSEYDRNKDDSPVLGAARDANKPVFPKVVDTLTTGGKI